jgi:hypothetical protein
MSYLLKKKMKMVAEAELHAIAEIVGSYKIGAQSGRNPNRHSRAFPHVVPITEPGVKVEAIFQMTSVLRAGSVGLKTWWNRLE